MHAAPEVRAQALPFLRILFVFNIGMLVFFMLGGVFRAAGDAQTPLRLGIALTILNAVFNLVLIPGFGPVPAFGTRGAAIGTSIATGMVGLVGVWLLFSGRCVIRLSLASSWRPDWPVIGSLFRLGLPSGFQGVAMNLAGVLLLRFIGSLSQSAQAQAAYAVGYTELFSFITWTSVGLMGAAAAVVGQNLGAGKPERSDASVRVAARFGLVWASLVGVLFMTVPRLLFSAFGLTDPTVLGLGVPLLRYLAISGLFVTVALSFTGGLQGSGDTRSPFYISVVSQIVVPIGTCAILTAMGTLEAHDIWRAIVAGHVTRCLLSVWRFRQGKWRDIKV